MIYYHSGAMNISELFSTLTPVVKAYARAGTRKPRDVAIRLNADGFRTASGALWTTRLARFLLALMFLEPKREVPSRPNKLVRSADKRLKGTLGQRVALNNTSGPLTQDELVKRLSKLGRVVMKKQ